MPSLDAVRRAGSIAPVLALALRTTEFLFYHLLLSLVDRVTRLPRDGVMPEAMRLYRENIALKAQIDALHLCLRLHQKKVGRRRVPLAMRAAQVFAWLVTRRNDVFQHYYLSGSLRTIERWASRFRSFWRRRHAGGRPPTDPKLVELVLTLKRENPLWGEKRIRDELRRMGIRLAQATIGKILRDHGFRPVPCSPRPDVFDRFRAGAKDALWALDFFAVKTAKGVWVQALLVIDIYTREVLELRVHDGWDVDSRWTARVFNAMLARTKRKPIAVVHDHGTHFMGQFRRQMRVLDIDEELTAVQFPALNCYAEAAIGSLRRELLRHIRVADVTELQFFLDEFRRYMNADRAHQGIEGRTPLERSSGAPEAEVIDLAQVRARRLVRREYAHGLLHGYELVDVASDDVAA
jgi:hypothetical protein